MAPAEPSRNVPRSARGERAGCARRRITRPEAILTPAVATQLPRQDNDPLGPLSGALESIKAEPPNCTSRLARVEEPARRPQRRRPRFPFPVVSPLRFSPAVRAARSHRGRGAADRA
ncbi:hypothetical protein ACFVYG_20315 [Streptomyces sp. NPDC058256]|uniref:hypothetical protein n=1 Tax=Streptomyces sp. NPDC058256 TaxID=3346408 RepID=UPI0036ED88E6